MEFRMSNLAAEDPEVFAAIKGELIRQNEGLELIASENFTSYAVMEAAGSIMTNKYAEGVPGKRYYGGCEFVDKSENLAIERAKALFGAEHANVQPHSGTQANMAVYFNELVPGDTMLAMDLNSGGHLTHGAPVNFSGRYYKVVPYGLKSADQRIDYDQVAALAKEHHPKLIVAGASAYPRAIDFAKFGEIARESGAKLMVDMAHIAGLVAAGIHQNPVPYADYVTTTTHKTLRGPRGGLILTRQENAKSIDSRVCPTTQGGPLCHIIAAKAVALKEAMSESFASYQRQIVKNARALADELLKNGFTLVSGGTDNHLILVDLRSKQLTGKVAEKALGLAGLTVNKNMIPGDPEKPLVTSGIRLGTPALTTRGMKESEMVLIGQLITKALADPQNEQNLSAVRAEILALAKAFPLYPELTRELAHN